MQAGHYNALLPEVFRHRSSHVRVYKPQVVLLDFHGTVSERRWEDKVVNPYVKKAVGNYIKTHWSSEAIQRCLIGLRSESFEQRFRNKNDDVPVIDDEVPDVDESEQDVRMAEQMSDFVSWQLSARRETKETQIIERLVWQDGYRQKQIQTPLYEDVMPCIKNWHDKHGCSIYLISSVDSDTLKLLMENTDRGNLHQYMSGYVSTKKSEDKTISETYKQFASRLKLKTTVAKKDDSRSKSKSSRLSKSPGANHAPRSPSTLSSPKTPSSGSLNSLKSSNMSPQASETNLVRPILFLTDSGPEAKAAIQANNLFECLLVNRPGNKRFRTYYLSQFQFVEKFDDIEFV